MKSSYTSSPSASHIAVALPSGGTDVEGARQLMRERLALWGKWVFFLSSGFYLANLITWPLAGVPDSGLARRLIEIDSLCHLAASLIFGGVWLVTRRRRLSLTALRALDVAALVGGCTLFAIMGSQIARLQGTFGPGAAIGLYSGLLACVSVISARATSVPSTATRTFWASSVAMLPIVPATLATTRDLVTVVNIVCWCAVTIAVATVGSRVIFGLRTEAARVRRLGQYTLEEKLGAGGMGVVYRARHAMLRRPTAIKLLPPDRAGETNLLRFEREVQITAELSHPNTVAIYDYGRTPDGIFYYAMELLDGINLEDLVRRDGPVPPGRVIAILTQVCGALAEAHDRGLLHRDIKPANIILTERGGEPDVAKVVDFGLVKRLAADGPDVTRSASILLAGTPLYMPPESLTSPGGGDPRSDLYAVGAVGYFLLTGKPVFEASTVAEVFGHHLHSEPVPPSERVDTFIPPDLEAVILRCLRKTVDERPGNARTLALELRRAAHVEQWTVEDARAWWQEFRQTGPGPASAPPSPLEAVTVTVDLEQRLTSPVKIG